MNTPAHITDIATTGITLYKVLVGAIIVQLILGTVYGYSIFWEPLDAEIFHQVITQAQKAELEANGKDTSAYTVVADEKAVADQHNDQKSYLKYAFSICILSFAVVMVIAGRIQDIRGPRFTAIIGAILMGGGFLVAGAMLGNRCASSYSEFGKLFILWATIGFIAGAGIGFAYVCPIAALVKWFPEKKGLVSGLAVAGFGFGAYLFTGRQLGALGYIEEHGINQFFTIHGIICLIGIIIGALLLKNPPGTITTKKVIADSNWQDTIRRPAFYILWLMFFSGAMAGLMVIGIVKGFAGGQLVAAAKASGLTLDADATKSLMLEGAAAVGWLAIFNAVGRIFWGSVSDKIGRTIAFVAMFALQAVMLFLLSRMDTKLTLAVGASIVGFNFGGNFALFPSATADLFGAKNLGANYGWVFTSYGIAGVVGIAAGNKAMAITGSYTAAFIFAAILCLISAAMAIGLRISQKRVQTQ